MRSVNRRTLELQRLTHDGTVMASRCKRLLCCLQSLTAEIFTRTDRLVEELRHFATANVLNFQGAILRANRKPFARQSIAPFSESVGVENAFRRTQVHVGDNTWP